MMDSETCNVFAMYICISNYRKYDDFCREITCFLFCISNKYHHLKCYAFQFYHSQEDIYSSSSKYTGTPAKRGLYCGASLLFLANSVKIKYKFYEI